MENQQKIAAQWTEEEYDRVVRRFNDTATVYDMNKTVHQLFEEQAALCPDHIAVAASDGALTFAAMNRLADSVASALVRAGVRPGDLVPVLLPRRSFLPAAMFGVMKSGGAYLPVDPDYPAERIRYTLQDCGAKVALAARCGTAPEFDGAVLYVEDLLDGAGEKPQVAVGSDDLCYAIYTSGSTGRPKGTLLTHRGVVNFVHACPANPLEQAAATEGTAALAMGSIAFDISLMEFFTALLHGKTVVLADEEEVLSAARLARRMREYQIDIVMATPSRLALYLENEEFQAALGGVRILMVGGENLPVSLIRAIRRHSRAKLLNGYGPSETTMAVSFGEIVDEEVTIGRPIANTQLYIVDSALHPLPIGVAGELCVAGDCVGNGYLHRPELTAEKFIDNPFGAGKLYRTGDLVQWREDGRIAFIGRMDQQVKLRGLRIELGEIEAAIENVAGVEQAAVLCPEIEGTQYLCAFFTGGAEVSVIREEIARNLTRYMVPQIFHRLEAMPLTGSGKIDRKALPAPDLSELTVAAADYEAPRNEKERLFASLLETSLGVSPIGVYDNYFDLGGDSLKAIQYIAKLEAAGYRASVREWFVEPTVAALAEIAAEVEPEERRAAAEDFCGEFPATPAQRRVYAAQLLAGGTAYNMPVVLQTERPLDKERLLTAFKQLVARHESLRTHFEERDGAILQIVEDEVSFALDETDKASFVRPFDLAKAPLMRAAVYGCELYIDMHHTISDGATVSVIAGELSALLRGDTLPQPVQYRTFAREAQDYARSEACQSDRTYWAEMFQSEVPDQTVAPDDASAARVGAAHIRGEIDAALTGQILQKARRLRVTPYVYLMGAFGVVLSRYAGSEELSLGTLSSGRDAGNIGVVGMLVNTMPIRLRVPDATEADAYVRRVGRTLQEALRHQRYPFEELAAALGRKFDGESNPLFDILFAYQDEIGALTLDGMPARLESRDEALSDAKFNITVNVQKDGDILRFCVEYRPGRYRETSVRRLMDCYAATLAAMLENRPLGEISILPEAMYGQVVREFNQTGKEYPKAATVPDLFEEQARRNPDKTAVAACDGALSYGELNRLANGVARALQQAGVGPGDIVPMLLPRRGCLLAGLLGILKSGAAYLPIDPEYPAERIAYMVEDCGAQTALLGKEYRLENFAGTVLYIEECLKPEEENPERNIASEDICYCIYTSGSTGKPKGTLLTHKNAVNYAKADAYGLGEKAKILSVTTVGFDIFGTESILPLVNGMQIVLANEEETVNAKACGKLVEKEKPDVIQTTPSKMRMLLGETEEEGDYLKHIKTVILGGEAVTGEIVKKIREKSEAAIYDSYGPTETTIWSTNEKLEGEEITIGRPIANTQIYIVNKNLKAQPVGAAGELCIAGDGVGKGYLNRPELTAEKFVENPFGEGKMYRTGDLAKWREDGKLEFIGRMDSQVKIRGLRVELGEIEAAVSAVSGVRRAAVLCHTLRDAQYLCAYYTGDAVPDAIRESVAARLPRYMTPHFFYRLDTLPLTPSGKLDRRALPLPDLTEVADTEHYAAPEGETERLFAALLAEILPVARIGRDENFFALGGDSLKAIQYAAKLTKAGYETGMREIFAHQTIAELAAAVPSRKAARETTEPFGGATLPAAPAQRRVYTAQLLTGGTAYNLPQAFKMAEPIEPARLFAALSRCIERHESLRTRFAESDGQIVQIVEDRVEFAFDTVEKAQFVRPFDLTQAPLLRAAIYGNELWLDLHHIVGDGATLAVLADEIDAFLCGRTLLAPVQYREFTRDALQYASSAACEADRSYWLEQFSGELPDAMIAPDNAAAQREGAAYARAQIDAPLVDKIKEKARRLNVTPYAYFMSCFGLVLSRYAGSSDVVFGTVASGRDGGNLQMVGMLVNTLAVRLDATPRQRVDNYVRQTGAKFHAALAHQKYPFESLAEDLGLAADGGRNPLFEIIFVYQDEHGATLLDGKPAAALDIGGLSDAKFDISLEVSPYEGGMRCNVEYRPGLYSEATIQRLLACYRQALAAMLADVSLSEICILPEEMYRQVVVSFNDTAAPYNKRQTVHGLFEAQVRKTPEQTALVACDRTLTFRELNARANGVAQALRAAGVKRGEIVPFLLTRTSHVFAAMFGVMKSGAAYLPIDPEYPADRVAYMLEDCGARLALTESAAALSGFSGRALRMDEIADGDERNPQTGVVGEDLCYCIYTSGSTGRPKGTLLNHRNVGNFTASNGFNLAGAMLELGVEGVISTITVSFDAFVQESLLPLVNGIPVIFATEEEANSRTALRALTAQYPNCALLSTASKLGLLLADTAHDDFLARFKAFFVGGERFEPALLKRLTDETDAHIINNYGPTETTVAATFADITAGDITIGKPIANTQIYIVDPSLQPQPVGVPGELCIAGDGVGLGYLRRPELTAKSFVDNPFGEGKMYRTGDLAKWREDGRIDFIGRIDNQVKIRGLRIELGEIEAAVLAVGGVEQAAVLCPKIEGTQYLCAYYTGEATAEQIRAEIEKRLTRYMVPHFFMQLPQLPLTPGGKLDRKALPLPDIADLRAGAEYRAPESEAERLLCAAFAKVLRLPRVGVDDSFFELGGDSLKAISLVNALAAQGCHATPKAVMAYVTPRRIAEVVRFAPEKGQTAGEQGVLEGDVPLHPIQEWFLRLGHAEPQHFNQSMTFHSVEALELDRVEAALREVVLRNDALRLVVGANEQHFGGEAKFSLRAATPSANCDEIRRVASELERGHCPAEGCHLGALLYEGGKKLFVTIHHWAVDGVSWGIFAASFADAYRGGAAQPKTASVRQWNARLRAFAQEIGAETAAYWQGVVDTVAAHPLPLIPNGGVSAAKDCIEETIVVDPDDTKALLEKTYLFEGANPAELLLALTALAYRDATGSAWLPAQMEGHGREDIGGGLDVSRTMGWFTSAFPLAFETCDNLRAQLRAVKRTWRNAPDRGVGYSALVAYTERLTEKPLYGMGFNYLGEVGAASEGFLQPAYEEIGCPVSEKNASMSPVGINAFVAAGRLRVEAAYDPGLVDRAAVDAWIVCLKQRIRDAVAYVRENANAYPALEAQAGLYLACIADPKSLKYNERFEAFWPEADARRLERAYRDAVAVCPALHVRFKEAQGEILQIVDPEMTVDISVCPMEEPEFARYRETFSQPFDLASGPLYRIALCTTSRGVHVLQEIHHIVFDRTSGALLAANVAKAYRGESLVPERYSIFAAVTEEKYVRDTPEYMADRQYFLDRFRGMEAETLLPYSETRGGSGMAARRVDTAVARQALQFAKHHGLTGNAVTLAALQLALAAYTGSDEVVVGTVSSGRENERYAQSAGMFVRTVPLYHQIDRAQTVLAYMSAVQENVQESLAHHRYAYSELVRETNAQKSGGRNPIFDVMYVYENVPGGPEDDAAAEPEKGAGKFALAVTVEPQEDGLTVAFDYDPLLYGEAAVQSALDLMLHFLAELTRRAETVVGELAPLPQSEYDKVVKAFNATAVTADGEQTVPALFAAQAAKTPRQTAFAGSDGALTYEEAAAQTALVARSLARAGVATGEIVPVFLPRRSFFLPAMFGVMQSGGVYLPIDPEYPPERVAYMLEDCGAKVMIAATACALPPFGGKVLFIEDLLRGEVSEASPILQDVALDGGDLCYCIYTSGSTGKPKGTLLTHRGVVNFVRDCAVNNYQHAIVAHGTAVLAVGSVAFDISLSEILVPVLHGKLVIFADEQEILSAQALARLMVRHNADILNMTPSRLAMCLEDSVFREAFAAMKVLLTAGESLSPALMRQICSISNAKIFNGYGPSETTIGVSFGEIGTGRVTIGRPIANTQIYILNARLQPLPVGAAGELCIAGASVGKGYLNRPELTAEKFVVNPFGEGKLYRTGDLAKWNENGTLDFIGRIDNQVKIRGLRIELGEIEAAIAAVDDVRQAAVLCHTIEGTQYLCAYYTGEADADEIRAQIAKSLTQYMMPHFFLRMEALPTTSNGKLDRKALPAPELADLRTQAEYAAPETAAQRTVCEAFAKVLKIERVGIDDSFFELGGDSLKAISLVSQLAAQGKRLTPKEVMAGITPRHIAELLTGTQESVTTGEQGLLTGHVPLHPMQQWLLRRVTANPDHFNQSLTFAAAGPLDAARTEAALREVVLRHDALRLCLRDGVQVYGTEANFVFRTAADGADRDAIQTMAAALEAGHCLAEGRHLGALLYEGGKKLFVSIHHWAVDGVSWGIFAAAFEACYRGADEGEKTASVRQWNEQLRRYAEGEGGESTSYWLEVARTIAQHPLPLVAESAPSTVKECAQETLALDAADTAVLFDKRALFGGANPAEILLGVAAAAYRDATGGDYLPVQMEGHGREDIGGGLDISRTMGWFTSLYPLAFATEESLAAQVRQIKKTWRNAPDKGIAYGALQCYVGTVDTAIPQGMTFNYLGAVGETAAGLLCPAREEIGDAIGGENSLLSPVSINALLLSGSLRMEIGYDPRMMDPTAMRLWLQSLRARLREAVDYARAYRDAQPILEGQKGIYLACVAEPESMQYNERAEFRLAGVDAERLAHALTETIAAYPAMRVYFREIEGEILQFVDETTPVEIPCKRMSEAELQAYRQAFARPFDLRRGPLYRFAVCQTEAGVYVLQDVHHIVFDRTSGALLWDNVSRRYDGRPAAGESYSAFDAACEEAYAKFTPEYMRDRAYFLERFRNTDAETYLEPAAEAGGSGIAVRRLDEATARRVLDFGRRSGVTGNAVALAALELCLSVYTGSDEIVLGTVSSGRENERYAQSAGMFVRTVPLYHAIDRSQTVRAFVQNVQENVQESLLHYRYSYAELVGETGAKRSDRRNPIFDIMYVYENVGNDRLSIGGAELTAVEDAAESAEKFALTVIVEPQEDAFAVAFEYDTALYNGAQMERALDLMLHFLAELTRSAEMAVGALAPLPQNEYDTVVNEFNATAVTYDRAATVPRLFAAQAAKTPDRAAFVGCDRALTFAEVAAQADAVARGLVREGVLANQIVPVLVPRRSFLLPAMLGAMQSGGAYLPIDPEYPPERISYMLADCGAKVLIAGKECAIPAFDGKLLFIEDLLCDAGSAARTAVEIDAEDLCYSIYTSGSTGKPKGTLLQHRGVVNLVQDCQANNFQHAIAEEGTAALAVGSIAFDISLFEILTTVLHGKTVVFADEQEVLSAEALARLMTRHAVDVMAMTPSRLAICLDNAAFRTAFAAVKVLTTAGESLPPSLIRQIRNAGSTKIFNGYGPSETTMGVSFGEIVSDEVTIGKPVANTQLYVLDARLRPLPVGVPGELCIAGDGVGKGYLNRPELTAEKFVANLFGEGRLYRTGDLAKWNDDGTIGFIGRIDDQVKIRGLRIELGEIETAIAAVEGVRQAAVLCHTIEGTQYLCAYYTGETEADIIRAEIAKHLTQYMTPQFFRRMDALPTTSSGKLDRKALPVPELSEMQTAAEYAAPETAAQRTVCEAFAKVLKIARVGIDDSFFELGGDSLKAISLVSALAAAGCDVTPKEIMRSVTPRRLAEAAASGSADTVTLGEQGVLKGEVPMHPMQIHYLENRNEHPEHFNQSMVFASSEPLDAARAEAALEALLWRHDALRLRVGETTQQYGETAEFAFVVAPENADREEIKSLAAQIEAGHRLENGRLLGALLYENGRKLFVTIHHWAVDGVSWGVFAADFGDCYRQIHRDRPKTASVRQWNAQLQSFAAALGDETVAYWQQTVRTIAAHPLPTRAGERLSKIKAAKRHTVLLDANGAAALLGCGHLFGGANPAELLLGVTAQAYRDATGEAYLPVQMEGHGREEIGGGLDVSRTMGWFTSLYPLVLETDEMLAAQVRQVKKVWRNAPDKGLSYAALQCYTDKLDVKAIPYGVIFNYLGVVGETTDGLLRPAYEEIGDAVSEENWLMAPVSVNIVQGADGLRLEIAFDPNLMEDALVQRWTERIERRLREAVAYAREYAAAHPLLAGQKGIYLACAASPESLQYNEWAEAILRGVDAARLAKAFETAIGAYPAMRAYFREAQGEILQFASAQTAAQIPVCRLSEAELNDYRRQFSRPFDLRRGPLYHIEICETEAGVHVLQDIHHIVFDRTSGALLWENVRRAYEGLSLLAEPYTVFDAAREEAYMQYTPAYIADRAYFLERFRGLETETYLEDAEQPGGSGAVERTLDAGMARTVLSYGRRSGVTGNALVLAALELCLSTYTGGDEVVVGTVASGRENERYAQSAGMFVRTVPLYHKWDRAQTVMEFLQNVQGNLQETLGHYRYSYAELVSETGAQRGGGRTPIFDVMYVYENVGNETITVGGAPIEAVATASSDAEKFALTVAVEPLEDAFVIALGYDTRRYGAAQMECMLDLLLHFLTALTSRGDAALQDLPPLPQGEYDKVVKTFNATEVAYERTQTVHGLFEQQAARDPRRMAVAACDKALTYGELDEQAELVADALFAAGVAKGDLVPMILPRRSFAIAALLGIMKAGGVYTPIDPEYPTERVAYMLDDCDAKALITTKGYDAPAFKGRPLYIEDILAAGLRDGLRAQRAGKSVVGDDLCYSIYTSGSTGKPKGTLLMHRNVVNFLLDCPENNMQKAVIEKGKMALAMGNLTFDISLFEILLSLTHGIGVAMASESDILSPGHLAGLIEKYGVNIMHSTPSRLVQYLGDAAFEKAFAGIAVLMVGGEAFSEEIYKTLRRCTDAMIFNGYGPSETTMGVSFGLVKDGEVTIGRPIANTRLYVLDEALRPVPVGVAGELCIAGDGVGKGYLKREELTTEKFVCDPFMGGVMYRSGDRVKWSEDGRIRFIARMDNQVKIRGLRVELGEIEKNIAAVNGVKQTAVLCHVIEGTQYLCAYYAGDAAAAEIRREIAGKLPQYMTPHFFKQMEALPMTPSGKLDRKALTAPALSELQPTSEYAAPESEKERLLSDILEGLLKISPVGKNDHYFDLGGDSLKAIQYAAKLEAAGYRATVREIFDHPTVAELAEILRPLSDEADGADCIEPAWTGDVPAAPAQRRVYTAQLLAGGTAYNIPVAVRTPAAIDETRLLGAFRQLIARHESLRTHFVQRGDEILQVIEPSVTFEFSTEDKAHFVRPFDLAKAPLLRAARYDNEIWIDIHHIVADGASMPVLMGELDALLLGKPLPRPQQYRAFALDDLRYRQSAQYQEDKDFWTAHFTGTLPDTAIFPDDPDGERDGAANFYDTVDASLTAAILKKARELKVTPYVYFFASFNLLLSQLTASDDVVVGSVASGRDGSNLHMLGMLVNTLAIRSDLSTAETVDEYILETSRMLNEVMQHQRFPFEDLIETLGLRYDHGRNPLFGVMFAYQAENEGQTLDGMPVEFAGSDAGLSEAKFDVTFEMIKEGDEMVVHAEYRPGLYRRETIQRVVDAYKTLLASTLEDEEDEDE